LDHSPFQERSNVVFSTIVVGVHGREGGRDALALGERLRAIFGADLIAVNAYPYDFFVSRGPARTSSPSCMPTRTTWSRGK
jgi:hypothetical protein